MLRRSYSADIGITTETTSNVSSTRIVLVLKDGRQDCQPCSNTVNHQQALQMFLSN